MGGIRQSRIITGVIVCLLLGAIANVAVAWALSLIPYGSAGTRYSYLPDAGDLVWWGANAPPGFPSEPVGVDEQRLLGRRNFLMFEQFAGINGNTLGTNCGRFQRGWPCLSMESAIWVNRTTRVVVQQGVLRIPNARISNAWPFAGRWVPLELIWPGFAINTLLYAATLWVLFAALLALRRWRRIGRGLCPACAYPIGVSDVCTECGKPMKKIALKV